MYLWEAIGHIEGVYANGPSPNRPQRNNNPGNLNLAPWIVEKYGATLEDGPHPRFAKFKTMDEGWAALKELLTNPDHGYAMLTIEKAINRYAPQDDGNNTVNYVEFVCHQVSCDPQDLVLSIMNRK